MNKKAVTKIQGLAIAIIVIVAVVVPLAYYLTLPEDSSTPTPTALKVARIVDGPLYEKGWSEASYLGVKNTAEKYGFDYTFSDYIAASDYPSTVDQYVDQGYDIIIPENYYGASLIEVAEMYPDVQFWVGMHYLETRENLIGFTMWSQHIAYIIGMLAGHLTETGKVAAMLSFEQPDQVAELNGFIAGVHAVDAEVEVIYSFTGTWFDVAKGYETANSFMDSGADFIYLVSGGGPGYGGVDATSERTIDTGKQYYAVGAHGHDWWEWLIDDHPDWKESLLTSSVQNWTVPLDTIFQMYLDETLEAKNYDFSMVDGTFYLAPFRGKFAEGGASEIPQEVIDEIKETKQQIVAGTLEVPVIMDLP